MGRRGNDGMKLLVGLGLTRVKRGAGVSLNLPVPKQK